MKNKLPFLASLSCFLAVISCAPVRTIVPLDKGDTHISASLGGPIINFSGLYFPIPLTSVNVSHGISNTTTLNGSLHTTSMLFGVIQIEASFTQRLYLNEQKRLGFSTNGGLYFMTDTWEMNSKFYPMLDLSFFAFQKNKEHFAYFSYSQMLETGNSKAFNVKINNRYIPSAIAGYTWSRSKMNYTVELRYMSFLQSNENIVVDYFSPGKKGAFGLQLGVTRKF
jgi:hypothetical protein